MNARCLLSSQCLANRLEVPITTVPPCSRTGRAVLTQLSNDGLLTCSASTSSAPAHASCKCQKSIVFAKLELFVGQVNAPW